MNATRSLMLLTLFSFGCGERGSDPSQQSPSDTEEETIPTDTGTGADAVPVDLAAVAIESGTHLSADAFEHHLSILADDDMEGRDNLTAGGARARAYLAQEMAAISLTPAGSDGYEQAFEQGVNLVGSIGGSDPTLANEVVIISAHYDHLGLADEASSQCHSGGGSDNVCNGAADNAAGCAAVLLLAEAILDFEVRPRRTILVIFWDAEEDGLLGSRHFVDTDPLVPASEVAAMFSLDIVGTELIPDAEMAFALGIDYSDDLRALVHATNSALDTPVYPASLTFDGGDGGRSDHRPFHDAGVPVIFYGSGSSPEYHTPADELDVVHTDLALMLMRHVLLMTVQLAQADARPAHHAARTPHIDDAVALRDFGRLVLANPSAVGLTDQGMINVLEGWIDDLEDYIADPPESEAQWNSYQRFIDQVILAVYTFLP